MTYGEHRGGGARPGGTDATDLSDATDAWHEPRRRAMLGAGCSLLAVLLCAVAGLGYLYVRLDGNLDGIDINSALGTDRPRDVADGSTDVLVLGSDSRAGANRAYGRDQGTARSDTAMLLHIHQGHRAATVVSIPRDTLVHRPACPATGVKGAAAGTRGGGAPGARTVPAAARTMFNSAYEVGGPACTVKTVEAMTGIRVDHYLEVDFAGFRRLVDTLGGVRLRTTAPIHDRDSHLDLPAGTHTLDGEQSLGLVRTRHGVGDGSDLGRIRLQQAFLRALLDQVGDVDLYRHPKRLYDLADAATKALTTDSELASVNRLLGFVRGLRGLAPADLSMVTLPVRYDPADPNRVLPLADRAALIWAALRADQPVPAAATRGSAADPAGPVGPAEAGGVVRRPR